jgi:hypothetical protein
MPITNDAEGRFSGEGWVTGSPRGAFWMQADGWAWFPAESVWRYMIFMRSGGPTWEAWQAAGMPVFAPEPSGPPLTTAIPDLPASGHNAPSPPVVSLAPDAGSPRTCALGHAMTTGLARCPTCGMSALPPGKTAEHAGAPHADPARAQGLSASPAPTPWRPGGITGLLIRLVGAYVATWVLPLVPYAWNVPYRVGAPLLALVGFVLTPRVVGRALRVSPAPQDGPAATVSSLPAAPPSTSDGLPTPSPLLAPGLWDGEGWVQHDGDLIFRRGDGHYYSKARGEWTHRPDLLTGALAAPPTPPVNLRVQQEVQNLRQGWPTPREAWQARKYDRVVKALHCCGLLALLFVALNVIDLSTGEGAGDNLIRIFFGVLALPIVAFYGYLRVVWKRDRKKGLTLFFAASAAQGLFGRAVNSHIANSQLTPMRVDPDPYSLNRVMRP